MDDAERARRREFVAEHRTAVFGYPRRDDGPSMSVVYYVMDGDERILVSTMRDRGKAKAVARNPRVSLCVLDEQWPQSYLLVYATVEVDPGLDNATDLMMRISEVMAGHPMPPEARADAEEMCRREDRLVLRSRRTPPSGRPRDTSGRRPTSRVSPTGPARACPGEAVLSPGGIVIGRPAAGVGVSPDTSSTGIGVSGLPRRTRGVRAPWSHLRPGLGVDRARSLKRKLPLTPRERTIVLLRLAAGPRSHPGDVSVPAPASKEARLWLVFSSS